MINNQEGNFDIFSGTYKNKNFFMANFFGLNSISPFFYLLS